MTGQIRLNHIDMERLNWKLEDFMGMLDDRLGGEKIWALEISDLRCSSVLINEALSVIYLRIADDGLKELKLENFPDWTELDESLLMGIAERTQGLTSFKMWELSVLS